MQKKTIIKVNTKQNSTNNIPKPVKKVNVVNKPNTSLPKKIIINTTSMKKTKNISNNNYLTNPKITKDNPQRILSMGKTPKSIKTKNFIINKDKPIFNTEKKILTRGKTSINKFSFEKKMVGQKNININNTPKNQDLVNNRIVNKPIINSGINKIVKKPENKKEEKKIIYNRKILNNYISKTSKEKLEEYGKKNNENNISSLTTFEKIVLLQNLLKEMTSIKERFEGNKDKMIEKLYLNCYNYFNFKVNMKEIFDYCISRKPEEHRDYQLISNIHDYLDDDIYNCLYNFYFLIRNDNNLIFQIINLSDKFVYEELSDFIINFFYENIINSSFSQEKLLLIIYLLLEDLFSRKISNNEEIYKINIYLTYIKNSFLFYAFRALTRKIDVRNFLSSILNDIILKMESFRLPLSLDVNIVNRFLRNRSTNIHHSFIKFAKGDDVSAKIIKTKKKLKKKFNADLPYNQGAKGGNMFLKRTKKIEIGSSNKFDDIEGSWLLIHSKLSQSRTLNDSIINKPMNKDENEDINNSILNKSKTNINKEDDIINENKENKENNTICESPNIDENLKIGEIKLEIEIEPFFENNSVTLKYLKDKSIELKKSLIKNNINYAMKEYIKSLIDKLENNNNEQENNKHNNNTNNDDINKKSNEQNDEKVENNNNIYDKEIYSTSVIIEELKSIRIIKQENSFKELMRKIIINHRIVTKIIVEIINKIADNLIYIPPILKFISKMLNSLLEKKISSSKRNKLSYYNLYIFKINFLIGNILVPIISNPEFNGLVTTDIISQITSDNLKLIADIFEKMLSGELFVKNENPYMTLFNQFIIETMPKLFELVEGLEKNLRLPEKIKKLIHESNKMNRNTNYEYFKENPNENIEYESICFSWQNLYILLQIIIKNKKFFIDENKNMEQKIIFEKLLQKKEKFINLFSYGIKSKKSEFFILTKINYKDEFHKKLTSITNNNFDVVIPKLNNDIITAYKKCLTEVLCYVNILHKENLRPLSLRKDEIIYDPYIYRILDKKNRKDKYKNIVNKYSYLNISNNKTSKLNMKDMPIIVCDKEDADFRYSIFPQILDNIIYEISFNLDTPISQRIIFCCNYLKLYMRSIPIKYTKNNFGLLFTEVIDETKKNVECLKNSVLFEYYLKIKEVEKSNLILYNCSSQIRNLEKVKCIEYLYNKIELPIKLNIKNDQKGIITNIEYKNEEKNNEENNLNKSIDLSDYLENRNQSIKNFINKFPDFLEYEDEFDNILDIEEKANAPDAITSYFNALKKELKKEKIVSRFNKAELDSIIYDLENYILTKLYDKLFPSEYNKEDIFFYKKCARLSFIKPENVIPDKKMINESLMEKAIEHLNNIDDKLTPVDKIKSLAKAIEIIQNSINFSSGKDELGVDDTIKPLIYIMIKSMPKSIITNYQYCELYLNSELGKKQYGVVLSQIGLIIRIVKRLKYSDLIGITEEQFGIDEIEEDEK